MKSIIVILVFINVIYSAHCDCNTCSTTNNVACTDTDQFMVCTGGLPQTPAFSCPTGTVCTDDAQFCGNSTTVTPTCNFCNTCNDTGMFACTSSNTFTLCYGSTTPDSTSEYACPDDLVCYINSTDICINATSTGIGATCPLAATTTTAAPTTTTTINPLTDPQAFCADTAASGRYDITSDTTCRQYVNCFLSSGAWNGAVYTCPAALYFNATTALCAVAVPTRCAT